MLLVVAVLAGLVMAPKIIRSQSSQALTELSYKQSCKVPDGCRVKLDEGLVTLMIFPGDLPPLQNLNIEVGLEGIAARKVTMEFIGRDMAMGLMPFPLFRQKPFKGTDIYRGTGSISVCTVDNNMVWLARLVITSESTVRTVVFELET